MKILHITPARHRKLSRIPLHASFMLSAILIASGAFAVAWAITWMIIELHKLLK